MDAQRNHSLRSYAVLIALALGWVAALAQGAAEPAKKEEDPVAKRRAEWRKLLAAPRAELPATLERPVHVMLLFVDHWEPSHYNGKPPEWQADAWLKNYYQTASRHHDADGRMPQHTWFTYQLNAKALYRIAQSVFLGLGEVELHLHHGTADDTRKDNSKEFLNLMRLQLKALQDWGACLTAEPRPRTAFGFIHGDWALDNSRQTKGKAAYCGVRNELSLLRQLGCYADYTFPSGFDNEPTWLNTIFATRDSADSRSYANTMLTRRLLAQGHPPADNELTIFEGPGEEGVASNIDDLSPPTLEMMDYWVSKNIHIPGRDNWIFVKLYTHSAQALCAGPDGVSALVGERADRFYNAIEKKYNDGTSFTLHYVTAREAYNIARAAVDGRKGDPGRYRNYVIPAPADTHFYCNAPYRLRSFDAAKRRAELEITGRPTEPLEIWARDFGPGCAIEESASPNKGGSFAPWDGQAAATGQGWLLLRDQTPSAVYRLAVKAQGPEATRIAAR